MPILVRSFDALSPRRKRAWMLARSFIPRRKRWLFEGDLRVRGQLWVAERELLYETVRNERPDVAFEIGTWLGGGSTLFMAQAMYENQNGVLHTVETDRVIHEQAVAAYQAYLPHLLDHVRFHLGSSEEIFPQILGSLSRVDLLFLDGAEDPRETLYQFRLFEPRFGDGTVLACHDWASSKTDLVRDILADETAWHRERILGPPASVGMGLFRKIGRS